MRTSPARITHHLNHPNHLNHLPLDRDNTVSLIIHLSILLLIFIIKVKDNMILNQLP